MLSNLLRHAFDRKWVCAQANYNNPEPQTFPAAVLACVATGGHLVFIG